MISRRAGGRRSVAPDRVLTDDDETVAQIDGLGEAMFSEAETALALGASEKSLQRLFYRSQKARLAYHTGRLRTLQALRQAQIKHAQTNASMAMFLGRTYLGQAESQEAEDGEAFDVSGASQRLRDKLAAIAVGPEATSRRKGR